MLPISDGSKGQGPAMATLTFMTLCSGCFLLQLYLGGGQPAIPVNLGFIPGLMFGGASLPENVPVIPPPATMISIFSRSNRVSVRLTVSIVSPK